MPLIKSTPKTNKRLARLFFLSFFLLSLLPGAAQASPDLDHRFALGRIGALRAWDNADGLFADYVTQAYREFFATQSRFSLMDLSKTEAVLMHSSIPYQRLIEDQDILYKIAQSTGSDTLIRTKIFKEGQQFRFTLDWIHAGRMLLIARESFVLEEIQDIKASMKAALERMIRKVPFSGHVTGRDQDTVTVNIGKLSNLKRGDILVLGTLEEIKTHPLLKEIVDWRFAQSGKIEITQVEEGLSFGKILEEEPNRVITQEQKIINFITANENIVIHGKSAPPVTLPAERDQGLSSEGAHPEPDREDSVRLGHVGIGTSLGSFSRDYGQVVDNKDLGKSGSGLIFGGRTMAQIWLNRQWFTDLQLGYGFFTYAQRNLYEDPSVAASKDIRGNVTNFQISGGYRYLVDNNILGSQIFFKLGYHSSSYRLSISQAEKTAPINFTGLFLGAGGDLPLRDQFGLLMNLDFGILRNSEEETTAGNGTTANSVSDVGFTLAGYYRKTVRITYRVGIEFISQNSHMPRDRTVSHKVVSIVPAILYYF